MQEFFGFAPRFGEAAALFHSGLLRFGCGFAFAAFLFAAAGVVDAFEGAQGAVYRNWSD